MTEKRWLWVKIVIAFRFIVLFHSELVVVQFANRDHRWIFWHNLWGFGTIWDKNKFTFISSMQSIFLFKTFELQFVTCFSLSKFFWIRLRRFAIEIHKKNLKFVYPTSDLKFSVNTTPLEYVYSSRANCKWFKTQHSLVFKTKQKLKMSVKCRKRAISNFIFKIH